MAQHNEPTPDVAGGDERQEQQQRQGPWLIQVATRQNERLAIRARAVFDRLEGWQQLDGFVQVYRNPGCTYRAAVRVLAELHVDNVSAVLFPQIPLDPPKGDDPAPFYAGCRRHRRPRYVREDVGERVQRGIPMFHLVVPLGNSQLAEANLAGDRWRSLEEHRMMFTREIVDDAEDPIGWDVEAVMADARRVQEAIRDVEPQKKILFGVAVDYRAERDAIALEIMRGRFEAARAQAEAAQERIRVLEQRLQMMAAAQPED